MSRSDLSSAVIEERLPGEAAAASSSAERETVRSRRLRLTVLAGLAAKGLNYASQLAVMALSVRYLGASEFGLWITISTTMAWILTLDFGLGNCLRNMLGQAYGRDDLGRARSSVSTVFVMLCAVTAVLAGVTAPLLWYAPWEAVFNAPPDVAPGRLRLTVAIALIAFLWRLPLSITQIVYSGLQEGYRAELWNFSGNAAGLLLLLAIGEQASLPALALAMAGGPLAVGLVNAIYLFHWEKPWLRPSLRLVEREELVFALRTGGGFMLLQLAVIVYYQSDSLIIAHVLGQEAVASYNMAYKLYWVLIAAQGVFVSPLWPAYTEANVRGDHGWIRKTLLRSALLSLLGAGGFAGLAILFGRQAIEVLSGAKVAVEIPLLAGLGLWCVLYAWQTAFTMYLNGIGRIKPQSRLVVFLCPVNIGLCFVLAGWAGLPGVAVANALSMLPLSVWTAYDSFRNLRGLKSSI